MSSHFIFISFGALRLFLWRTWPFVKKVSNSTALIRKWGIRILSGSLIIYCIAGAEVLKSYRSGILHLYSYLMYVTHKQLLEVMLY
jgi:hypothetical protein